MQEKRRASLNDAADPAPSPTRPSRLGLFAVVALLVWTLDQVTKVAAVALLEDREPVTVVPGVLWLTFLRNPGAAFGAGGEFTLVISVLAMLASAVLLVMARRLRDRWWAVAFGCFLAGAVGNLTDRIFRAPGALHGHVVDFLELPNWPVFNVADISLNVAAIMIVIRAFQGIGLDGTREERHRKRGEQA